MLGATMLGLAAPALGQALQPAVLPLLAFLMLCISLTFDGDAIRAALRSPRLQVLAFLLVYGPMAVAALLLGRLFFGDGPLAIGLVLVAVLPPDVSAPLLVHIARGNVAFAVVMNALTTAVSPFVVPALFLLLTGVDLHVPVSRLVVELAGAVLAPVLLGTFLRTRFRRAVAALDPMYAAGSSFAYLALLLAVVGPNADNLLAYGGYLVVIIAAGFSLNLTGYLLGAIARLWTKDPGIRLAYLFTVSKKEFSIAAVVVLASGLPPEVAVPAACYAVLQMITSPITARLMARPEHIPP